MIANSADHDEMPHFVRLVCVSTLCLCSVLGSSGNDWVYTYIILMILYETTISNKRASIVLNVLFKYNKTVCNVPPFQSWCLSFCVLLKYIFLMIL